MVRLFGIGTTDDQISSPKMTGRSGSSASSQSATCPTLRCVLPSTGMVRTERRAVLKLLCIKGVSQHIQWNSFKQINLSPQIRHRKEVRYPIKANNGSSKYTMSDSHSRVKRFALKNHLTIPGAQTSLVSGPCTPNQSQDLCE